MHLVNYHTNGSQSIGFLISGVVIDLITAYQAWERGDSSDQELFSLDSNPPPEALDLMISGDATRAAVTAIHRFVKEHLEDLPIKQGGIFNLSQVALLAPVRKPGKIICAGLNYPPPPGEGITPQPPYPILFHKASSALTGHGSPIIIPHISNHVLYEGELALVIGKRGKNLDRTEALTIVAGYTIANDIGARDIEERSSQWASGKMFDTFCPLGPALVTKDDVPNPNELHIQTKLNGTLVQDGYTYEMIFEPAFLLSYISTLTTLEPGDLILTGSPKRLGELPDPRTPLQPGDTVAIEIGGLGKLVNPVQAEEI
jgi:2-keto-4-pentenoate hydratase/2-oxohepta-3-ene-1,7-dioic acid hydratase in catechol pathway